ncbi:hypothetical protein KA107_03620 [Candidatus Pacearchaeota archaeon]|nr:hypothetical protein [Candidatus Pacearchaeota archaeon]
MKNLGKILALGSAVLLVSCVSNDFDSSREPIKTGFPVYQSTNSSISLVGETDEQAQVDYFSIIVGRRF